MMKLLKGNARTKLVGSAFLTRGIGSGMQFLLSVFLGRLLGADGVGVYYLYTTWTNFLANLGSLGLPLHSLRNVSALDSQGLKKQANELVKKSVIVSLVIGVVMIVVALPLASKLSVLFLKDEALSFVIVYSVVGGLFVILVKLLSGALKARGHAIIALSFENSAVPTSILFTISAAVMFSLPVTVHIVILLHIFFMLVIAVLSAIIWTYKYQGVADEVRPRGAPTFSYRSLSSFWGLILLGASFNMIPLLLLPQFATTAEVGQFGVAHRLVTLASIILVALASIYSPRFSKHATILNVTALKQDLKESQVYSFVAYLPFLLAFLFLSDWILSLFGQEFTEAALLLWILALGQLVNAVSGLVGNFLNMTGRENVEFKLSVAFVVVLVVLIFVLGRLYGALGVAIAYSVTVAFKNLFTYIAVRRALQQMTLVVKQ